MIWKMQEKWLGWKQNYNFVWMVCFVLGLVTYSLNFKTYACSTCSPRWKLRYHTTASSMESGRTVNHLSFWWMSRRSRMEGWKRRRRKTKRNPNWPLRISGRASTSRKPSLRKCCAWDFAAGFLDGIWKIEPWLYSVLVLIISSSFR